MTRLLGVDLGERRIGLAIADRDGGRALPLSTLNRKPSTDEDAAAFARVVAEQDVDELEWRGADRATWEAFCDEWELPRLRARPHRWRED